ncbi:MAG TPA: hypothetical protein VKK61_03905, partial [Tepidisphaeraceae bacterium]|nr:hypothetical protein [Tepidisphaeraceae bacterium]
SAFAHEQQQYQSAGFDDVMTKPLRCERVYLCIAALLGVEFVDEKSEDRDAVSCDAHAGDLSVEMRARLLEAAEICNVTVLKKLVSEIEQIGPQATPIVEHLRGCLQLYDLQSIARFAAAGSEVVQA